MYVYDIHALSYMAVWKGVVTQNRATSMLPKLQASFSWIASGSALGGRSDPVTSTNTQKNMLSE